MKTHTCTQCGEERILASRPQSDICRKCSDINRRVEAKVWTRVCDTCGRESRLKYEPRATTCSICSGRRLGETVNRKTEAQKIRYIYFCPNCPDVKVSVVRRKGVYCGKCNSMFAKKPKIKIYYDLKNGKFEQVAQPIRKDRVLNPNKTPRRQSNAKNRKVVTIDNGRASSQAIEKIRSINKAHREEMKKIKSNKPTIQNKSDDELTTEWLNNNEVTACLSANEDIYHKTVINTKDSCGGTFL